jgi:hypothetical protein
MCVLDASSTGNRGRKSKNVRDGVSATSNSLLARLAVPDADRVSLDSNLSAESASVAGMLGHLHLLDLLQGVKSVVVASSGGF